MSLSKFEKIFLAYKHEIFTFTFYMSYKIVDLFYNLKLPLSNRYSITGWIVKKSFFLFFNFPFPNIIKNWDFHF